MNNKHSKNSRTLSMYVRLCAGKRINKAEEANRFGVDERSIQRDIDDIRAFLEDQKAESTAESREIVYDRIHKGFVMIGMDGSAMSKAKQIIELRLKASVAKEAIQKQFDEIDSKIAVKFLNEKYVALKKEVEKTRALGDTEIVNACNHVIGNISEFQNELSVVYGQYLQRKSE